MLELNPGPLHTYTVQNRFWNHWYSQLWIPGMGKSVIRARTFKLSLWTSNISFLCNTVNTGKFASLLHVTNLWCGYLAFMLFPWKQNEAPNTPKMSCTNHLWTSDISNLQKIYHGNAGTLDSNPMYTINYRILKNTIMHKITVHVHVEIINS